MRACVLLPGSPEANLVDFLIKVALAANPSKLFSTISLNVEQHETLVRIAFELSGESQTPLPPQDSGRPWIGVGSGEAAQILGVTPRTVTRHAKELGGVQIQGRWLFNKARILKERR